MIITRTPFRIPLGGGGTDLPAYYSQYGGSLITAAIDKYMYLNVNQPAISNKIKLSYSKVELIDPNNLDSIQHDIVKETLKYLEIKTPIEINSIADLPAGTGMGSSSSYTVGLLKSLNTFLRRDLSTHELSEEACKVEIELAGKPIGKQDQFAAAFGGIIHMDIDKSGNVKVTKLNLDQEVVHELENRFMIFYTGIERDANKILGEQSEKIKQPSSSKDDKTQVMHEIKNIGVKIKDALITGDISKFGKLMNEHWLTKKKVSSKMSNTNIDHWYDTAMNNGALGGKIMGAGGGGFLLLCCEECKRKNLRKTMEDQDLKYMDFKFDFEGSKVLANL